MDKNAKSRLNIWLALQPTIIIVIIIEKCNVVKFKLAKRERGRSPFPVEVGSAFEKEVGGGRERMKDLKFGSLNERNTQLTKQCAIEEASSGLAKSLLSFHLFSGNNSCPLIPCYSAVKNKTPL